MHQIGEPAGRCADSVRRGEVVDHEVTQRAVHLKLEIAQSSDVVVVPFARPVPCALQRSVECGQNLCLVVLKDIPGGVLSFRGYGSTGSLQYSGTQGLKVLQTVSQRRANILLECRLSLPCLALDYPLTLPAPVKAEGYREVPNTEDDGDQDPDPFGRIKRTSARGASAQRSLLAKASVSGSRLYSTARRIWETRVGLPSM